MTVKRRPITQILDLCVSVCALSSGAARYITYIYIYIYVY